MHIAIIGSGPTAIYCLQYLVQQNAIPFHVTVFESQAEAGKGMPYHPDWNHGAMLSNIASIEIPPVMETLVEWLDRQPDAALAAMNIERSTIDDRAFFPRLALGDYFHAQFEALVHQATTQGSTITVKTLHEVTDVKILADGIQLTVQHETAVTQPIFTHVIMATGHLWPEQTEVSPGYFLSPWPVTALQTIGQCHVGILGTSLSALDALVALATARGDFEPDGENTLRYLSAPGTEGFHVTLMSRKGLLPEADFYHPIPYLPLTSCTPEAVDRLIKNAPSVLLDAVYLLFKKELTHCDPAYAEKIGLASLALEEFCDAYFAERANTDPFLWAKQNLAEAQANQLAAHTVPWRYAILRMHEAIGRIAPHLNAEDHQRFNHYFKPIFVDDYATVPHLSIERLLALHDAGKLDIITLGEEYQLEKTPAQGGTLVQIGTQKMHFPAFIDATGQRSLSAKDFPFPSLREQGVIRNATAPHRFGRQSADIGGVALDSEFHPLSPLPYASQLYCLSLPFMLGQFPFAQGITSSHDLGKTVAEEIIKHYPSYLPVKSDAPDLHAA